MFIAIVLKLCCIFWVDKTQKKHTQKNVVELSPILWSVLQPLLNHFWQESRLGFLTGSHSVTGCVNTKLLDLTNASITVHFFQLIHSASSITRLSARVLRQPPTDSPSPVPPGPPYKPHSVWMLIKLPFRWVEQQGLLEMGFTSAPPHQLPHWPPVSPTEEIHKTVCVWERERVKLCFYIWNIYQCVSCHTY